MLFRNDIKILNIIKNQKPQLPNNFYDYRDIFQECKMPPEKYMISLRNLEENGAISFGNKEKNSIPIGRKRVVLQRISMALHPKIHFRQIDRLSSPYNFCNRTGCQS